MKKASMTHATRFFGASIVGLVLLGGYASAHHSTAMYDATKPLTLRGVVKQFRWINPHVFVFVSVEAPAGEEPPVWVFEASSPGNLTRLGWSRQSLPAGERVAVTFNPIRDGSNAGLCRKVDLLDKNMELTCAGAVNAGEKANLP